MKVGKSNLIFFTFVMDTHILFVKEVFLSKILLGLLYFFGGVGFRERNF
jgi:hypothetical protein